MEQNIGFQGLKDEGSGEILVKGHKFPVRSPGDLKKNFWGSETQLCQYS